MTEPAREEADLTPTGLAGRVIGGLVLDSFVNGAVFLSLVTVIAGFVTKQPGWLALGLVVGGIGIVLPWVGVYRKWPEVRSLLIAAAVVVADLSALSAMWLGA